MRAGVWNAQVLLRELRERNYIGGCTVMAEVALNQKVGTVLLMHEEAFREKGGPEEIFYDRMKTVWLGSDKGGALVWHPVFLGLRGTGDTHRGFAGRVERRPRGRSNPE